MRHIDTKCGESDFTLRKTSSALTSHNRLLPFSIFHTQVSGWGDGRGAPFHLGDSAFHLHC